MGRLAEEAYWVAGSSRARRRKHRELTTAVLSRKEHFSAENFIEKCHQQTYDGEDQT